MLLDQLQQDLKQSMLNKDAVKTSTLRMLLSEVNNSKISKGSELSDEELLTIVQKEVKKRKEAAEGFKKGGRDESAQKEETEAAILATYLPLQLSDEELTKIVESSINESGVTDSSEMGRVIGIVMAKVGKAADGGRVSALVKERL